MFSKSSRKTVAKAMLAAQAYRQNKRALAGQYLQQLANSETFDDDVEELVDVLEDGVTETANDDDPFMDGTEYDNGSDDDVTASEDDDEDYDGDEDQDEFSNDPETASLTKTLRRRTANSNRRLVQMANASIGKRTSKRATAGAKRCASSKKQRKARR